MVTMADVAREAGVSISTVSHVLNGTRRVLPQTAASVREAIDRTGYIHHAVARSLVTGGTMTVGVAMSAISNPYFGEVLQSIEQTLAAAGYSVVLVDTHDDPEVERAAVESLLTRRVTAVVLAPSAEPHDTLRRTQRAGVPVILVDRVLDADFDQAGSHNVGPTAQLVDHLVLHGHRRIGMIAGRPGLTTTRERLLGYRRGLRQHGIPFAPELVAGGDGTDPGAARAVDQLLRLEEPPSALVVGNNLMTLGAMRRLRAAGIVVPGGMALVAFDDFTWADVFEPRLTVMAQQTARLGERAARAAARQVGEPRRIPPDGPPASVPRRPGVLRVRCRGPSARGRARGGEHDRRRGRRTTRRFSMTVLDTFSLEGRTALVTGATRGLGTGLRAGHRGGRR